MYTEDEAKGMWCPMARVVMELNGHSFVINTFKKSKNDADIFITNCIASHCMMWRSVIREGYVEHQGYCGLAGKP